MTLVLAPRVVVTHEGRGTLRSPGWVRSAAGRLVAAGGGDELPPPAAPGEETVRLPSGLLVPGLVDAQINGAYGTDFATADADGWAAVLRRLPETGVTAVVPTLTSAPLAELLAVLRAFASRRPDLTREPTAARALGVHLEGPFLAEARRGAHRVDHLVDPTPGRVDALLDAGAGGALAYVTLAPERPHAMPAIRRLTAAGIRVAIGHTDATDQVVSAAADAGATLVTHLYNAQRPLHHRDPGTVGAALADPRLTLGLIADLHHVARTALQLAFAAAAGRVMLVTDAVAAAGMPPGRYQLGGRVVEVAQGRPPVRPDGTIAGTVLRLDEAIANAVTCGVDVATAVDAASRVPADALGHPERGRIAPGAVADLVWLSDELRTQGTWIGGRMVWQSTDAEYQSGVSA